MKLIAFTLLTFLSSIPFAQSQLIKSNPLIRICHQVGGEFVVFQNTKDEIPTCKIGHSYIGSLDLIQFMFEHQETLSINNYKTDNKTCEGQFKSLKSLEGQVIDFCLFSDSSILDIQTLTAGPYQSGFEALNLILGIDHTVTHP